MANILNSKLGYRFLVVLPSQVLQLVESCIVLLTFGFIYPGWVYKYVLYLNSFKNKIVEPIREEFDDDDDATIDVARMYREFQERLARRRAVENRGPRLREQFRPALETYRMEIMDFGTETADDQRPLIEIPQDDGFWLPWLPGHGPLMEVPNPRNNQINEEDQIRLGFMGDIYRRESDNEVYEPDFSWKLVGEEPIKNSIQNEQ